MSVVKLSASISSATVSLVLSDGSTYAFNVYGVDHDDSEPKSYCRIEPVLGHYTGAYSFAELIRDFPEYYDVQLYVHGKARNFSMSVPTEAHAETDTTTGT